MLNFIAYSDGGIIYDKNRFNLEEWEKYKDESIGYGTYAIFLENELKEKKRLFYSDAKTNNESEYKILTELLKRVIVINKELEEISQECDWEIRIDSRLVQQQLYNNFKVKAENLKKFNKELKETFSQVNNAKVVWVSRDLIVKVLGH